jgi:hypothetical protein
MEEVYKNVCTDVGLPQFREAFSSAAAVLLAIEDLFPVFKSCCGVCRINAFRCRTRLRR